MKKFITSLNPFILLLIPVFVALVMGINYQVDQAKEFTSADNAVHATSLFYKSIGVVKTICEVAQQKIW